jgi:hypothetical protein
LAGPGQSPGLTSLPGFSGPETDMRSLRTDPEHAGASAAAANAAVRGNAGQQRAVWRAPIGNEMRGWMS